MHVKGVDDHPAFKTPSSPRKSGRGSGGGGGGQALYTGGSGGSASKITGGGPDSPQRRSSNGGGRRGSLGSDGGYDDRDYGGGGQGDEERRRDRDHDDAPWLAGVNQRESEEDADRDHDERGPDDVAEEYGRPSARSSRDDYLYGEGYDRHDYHYADGHHEHGHHYAAAVHDEEHWDVSRGRESPAVTEPALGYPGSGSNSKRAASAGRAGRTHHAVDRGGFGVGGQWVTASGGGSPKPAHGKKTATDRKVDQVIKAKRALEAREAKELDARRMKMEEKARMGEWRASQAREQRVAMRR